jgi:hypothetical protein
VSIRTIILGAMAFGEVQAVGGALGSHVMGKITELAVDTLSVFQDIFTESNLVGIVNVATLRAFSA